MIFGYEFIVALTFVFGYYFLWSLFAGPKARKRNEPPKAGGAWPLIGHLHLFAGSSKASLPHVTFSAMAEKYGPIFTVQLGVHQSLIVSDSALVKEIFTTCDKKVSDRPVLIAGKHLGFDNTMFSMTNDYGYWREIRKLISREMLSPQRLEMLKHVRESGTVDYINEMYKLWEVEKDDTGRMMVELKLWLGSLNLNVMLRIVADRKVSRVNNGELSRLWEMLREFFHLFGQFVVADTLPYLRWLDIGGYEKTMKKNAKELDIIVEKWLEDRRLRMYPGVKQTDFMGVMLSTIQGINLGGRDPDLVIKTTCLAMIAGGSDSITIALVWVLTFLLNNRKELERAYEELDTIVGRDRRLNESDIQNLTYLQAIVNETIRLYGTLLIPGREFNEDCTVGGYHISKGTRLIVNLWKLHRDPAVWGEDHSRFRPERFLTGASDGEHRQNFEYLPFGAGRRMCPAMNLGLHMVHLVLANFLHAFDVTTANDELVDVTDSVGLANMKATPLHALVAPRLPPNLYVN